MAASQREIAEEDGSRRKIIIIVAVVAAILFAGLFYLLMRASVGPPSPPARLEGAIRPGSPDWDKYSKLIVLDDPVADEAKRPLGDIVMTLQTTVRNFTGKTINGLELRAAVVDQQGKAVKESTKVFIPSSSKAELLHNQNMVAPVLLEGMTDADDRANIKMELTGFRLKP